MPVWVHRVAIPVRWLLVKLADLDLHSICFNGLGKTIQISYSQRFVLFQWEPEIRHHCPLVPCILVGTKVDLRDAFKKDKQKSKDIVTTSEVQITN